jgi:SNF2 family DNA or RNA helicase
MSDPHVEATLLSDGVEVRLERSEGVPEEVWLQVQAETSAGGRDAAHGITLPVERFLARRAAIAAIVKRGKVRVTLDDPLRALVVQANSDRAALRQSLENLEPLDLPALVERLDGGRFTRKLKPFQETDLGHLLALSHGANFSVPGAGKTTVAYAAYEAERCSGRVERLLVIAPISAFTSWEDEARDCFAESPTTHRFDGTAIPRTAEVVLVNYHRLTSNYGVLASWVIERPTMVILDEAHRMKRGWDGQWGTACLNLAYLAQRRDILTGTPAPQGPRDFVALIDFLYPSQARRVLPADALVAVPPPDAGPRVAQAIKPLFVRTTKEQLDLPKTTLNPIVVPLEGLHREIYLALVDQYAGKFRLGREARRDFLQMGRILMYLLEAATNPKLLTAGSLEGADPDVFRHPPLEIPEGSEIAALLLRYNEYETAAKFTELAKLVKQNADAGRKTLVWSNFVRNLKLLQLQLAGYNPALVHGAVPPLAPEGVTSRETEIARFRKDSDCLVLLANPAAMSEGISLHHECHEAIFLERTFNAGQYLQSIDRIHRLGLDSSTVTRLTFLITAETIDVVVDQRVRDKAQRLGEMLDDENLASVALPNEDDYGPPVDDDIDVEALFRHLRGEDEQ